MLNKSPSFEKAKRMHASYGAALGRRPLFGETAVDRGSLYVYDFIGESWDDTRGVTGRKVAEALAEMKGVKALDIFINSPGGDIWEAKAIFAELNRFEGEKVVHIDGIAASAASFIAMVGNKIRTAPAATWMIHDVWTIGWGNAEAFRKTADVLDLESDTFAQTYATRTGQKVEDVRGWMKAETWMNAATAKERGFTDEIAETPKASTEGVEALVSALQQTLNDLRAARGN